MGGDGERREDRTGRHLVGGWGALATQRSGSEPRDLRPAALEDGDLMGEGGDRERV